MTTTIAREQAAWMHPRWRFAVCGLPLTPPPRPEGPDPNPAVQRLARALRGAVQAELFAEEVGT